MKINFTKNEYRQLVTMIEIADWVMNAHDSEEREDTKEYRILRNKILAFADEMGMKGCYEKEGDTYYETLEYEENSEQSLFIEAFEEDSFWEQLISKLVSRDYNLHYGEEENTDLETRTKRIIEIRNRYEQEIDQFGLINFVIKKSSHDSRMH